MISAALAVKFPGIDLETLVRTVGIDSPKTDYIKLSLVRQNFDTFKYLSNDQSLRDLSAEAAPKKLHHLDNWHLTPDAGLKNFVNFSPEDFAKLLKFPSLNQPLTVMAFQMFIEHACTPVNLKPLNPGIDATGVLDFISGWCGLNETEKEVLLNSMSPEGKTALQAVDKLVKKMIAARDLPLKGSESFGLGRDIARKQGFDGVQGLINQALIQPSHDEGITNNQQMKQAARTLGTMIARQVWADPATRPCNYIARQSELLQAIRAFSDRHFSVSALAVPKEHKATAEIRWRAYRESFAQQVCASALQAFYARHISLKGDGSIDVNGINYDLANGELLGKGGEGSVRRVRSASGQSIAAKIISPAAENPGLNMPLREAGIHHTISQLRHKNLVQMHGAVHDSQNNLLISMEYAPYGSADNYLTRFGGKKRDEITAEQRRELEQVDRFIFLSTLRGLGALQSAQVVHRDLKPANLFFGDGGVQKIGDFGKSVMTSESVSRGMPVDTPDWTAPELVTMSPTEFVDASPASDIWSAAMLTYTMVTGGSNPFLPRGFSSEGVENLRKFAADEDMRDFEKRKAFLKLDQLSDQDLANQLCHMLHPDPQQRPSVSTIINDLFQENMPDEVVMGKKLVELMSSA